VTTTATGSPTKRTLSMASMPRATIGLKSLGTGLQAEVGGGVDGDDAGHRQRARGVDAQLMRPWATDERTYVTCAAPASSGSSSRSST
jgi:hypothetical protein